MKLIGVYTLIFCGVFYFSEGKPCPEKTRPHKTRCEAFYKCTELPTKTHVWVPEICEPGLIYEHNLRICVLPAEDWECTLGDEPEKRIVEEVAPTDYVVDEDKLDLGKEVNPNKGTLNNELKDDGGVSEMHFPTDDQVEVVIGEDWSSEEDLSNDVNPYESSGDDGNEIMELDGFLQAENKESENHMPEQHDHQDSLENLHILSSTAQPSKIDPQLTEHLQRLSQLIEGLKQNYQSNNQPQTELRPDQLNAYLSHFNIKNNFDAMNPNIHDEKIHMSSSPSSTTEVPSTTIENSTMTPTSFYNKLKPETKVVLVNSTPNKFLNPGYSNSQIVVNRPEGSVLFGLPSYGNSEGHFTEHQSTYDGNAPKISEDTLKTVLELSKQMIANQNVPKIIPNPAYYSQPILQPLYIPTPTYAGQLAGNPFASYFNQMNNNHNSPDYNDIAGVYNKPSQLYLTGHKRPNRPVDNIYGKPGTTIIHNNVIPVHLSSSNSGEKDTIDSYGQSLGHNSNLYPPLSSAESGNSGYASQIINHLSKPPSSHRYENHQNNYGIGSGTTPRPFVSTTPSSSGYAGQYPPPYSNVEIGASTPRPTNQFEITPATVAEYYTPSPHLSENNINSLYQSNNRYPTIQYENIPRPMDVNRPSSTGNNAYQQHNKPERPYSTNSLFPLQIDQNKVSIRPNSEKIESMETDNDDLPVDSYGGSQLSQSSNQQYQQYLQQQPSVLTYNLNNERPDVSQQLTHGTYIDQLSALGLSGSNIPKNPYMPRPMSGSSASLGLNLNFNKPKYPNDGTQLVNIGGNFINYDVFQNSMLPLLGQTHNSASALSALNNIEVITCSASVRQPNMTDCTRYYVCSKKDGKVLSYSCPPFTAFNAEARICDAQTYSVCSPDAVLSSYTVSENKRIHLEAIKALQEAKRRREQTNKVQGINNLLQQYNDASILSSNAGPPIGFQGGPSLLQYQNTDKNILHSYLQQAAAMAATATATTITTTSKPFSSIDVSVGVSGVSGGLSLPPKKRKYYCKEGDKVPDQTSIYNYFVCYKNERGAMKGHKMTCSKGLLFCPSSTMCTLPVKCT